MRGRVGTAAPVIAFDVDGVLLDFDGAWRCCAEETLNRPVVLSSPAWDIGHRYGLSDADCRQVWTSFHQNGWWGRIDPYPYVGELMESLRQFGCRIVAITNADPVYTMERVVTLGGLVAERNIFMLGQSASPFQRAQLLQKLNARAFLDDLPENANAAAFSVPSSALLYRHYTDREVPSDGVTVIDDPLDFTLLLEGMLA